MAEKKGPKRTSPDYEVGYRKPPKDSRFKPGQSGNPKGRPKGTRNFRTDVKATLESRVNVTKDGKRRKISTQEATLLRLTEKALNGDIRALNQLLALAQTYNNEELPPPRKDLSGGDAALLEIYNARLLSGATSGQADSKIADQDASDDTDISEASDQHPKTDGPSRTRRRHIKRYRLARLKDETEGED